jgi:riboflavin biosynthesis pyrimidine reductase
VRQIYPGGPGTVGDDGGGGGESTVDLAAAYAYPSWWTGTGAGERPAWVRANMVTSADGATAVKGASGALSSDGDRQLFGVLRGLADVILVGAGTARAERYGPAQPQGGWAPLREGRPATPPIAIVTGKLDLNLSSPLLRAAPGYARTIVLTAQSAPPDRREQAAKWADVVIAGSRHVDLATAIGALAGRGLRRILTEGGPRLLGQLVAADLLDELCVTVSPLLAGGDAARITAGADLPSPRRFRLGHVLEAEGSLFCRYVRVAP